MYSEMNKIYDSTRLDVFCMAVAHLMDIGFRTAKELTDEEINAVEGNGLMTTEFCQMLCKLAREIANTVEHPAELIQFCSAKDIYDVSYYANKLNRKDLERITANAITALKCNDYDGETDDDLADYLGCDTDDLELLM